MLLFLCLLLTSLHSVFLPRVQTKMASSSSSTCVLPFFPTSNFNTRNHFDYLCFDPLIDYAQALAEAEAQKRQEQQEEEKEHTGTCLSPDMGMMIWEGIGSENGEQENENNTANKKGRGKRSWKNSLMFWKKKSQTSSSQKKIKAQQNAVFKSKSRDRSIKNSGDIGHIPGFYRSGSLAAMFGSRAQIPYLPLAYLPSHRPDYPTSRPIYLVT